MSYGIARYGDYRYGEEPSKVDIGLDEHLVDLVKYLPSNYQDRTNIQKLLNIIELELGELNYYALSLEEQFFIDKALWGLSTWEKELNIERNPSMSIMDRREIIKARLRGRGTTTKAMIKNTAEAFSGGEVDVIEYPGEYRFVVKFIGIRGIPRNMQGFIDMLDTIKPAHLTYSFKYTYTTCQMLIEWGLTCNETKEMTCTELKTYEKEVI